MKRIIRAALIVLIADMAAKYAASLMAADACIDWSPLLVIRCTRNSGMALSLLRDVPWAGYVLPPLAALFMLLIIRRYRLQPLSQYACGAILGGFIGNYAERLVLGSVLDMLYFPFLPFFVCNIADIALCAGIAVCALSLLLNPRDWQARKELTDGTYSSEGSA